MQENSVSNYLFWFFRAWVHIPQLCLEMRMVQSDKRTKWKKVQPESVKQRNIKCRSRQVETKGNSHIPSRSLLTSKKATQFCFQCKRKRNWTKKSDGSMNSLLKTEPLVQPISYKKNKYWSLCCHLCKDLNDYFCLTINFVFLILFCQQFEISLVFWH